MTTRTDLHRGHRFPREIIVHAVWLYHVFSLSLRDVELLLAERGVIVSYESIRERISKRGQPAGRHRQANERFSAREPALTGWLLFTADHG